MANAPTYINQAAQSAEGLAKALEHGHKQTEAMQQGLGNLVSQIFKFQVGYSSLVQLLRTSEIARGFETAFQSLSVTGRESLVRMFEIENRLKDISKKRKDEAKKGHEAEYGLLKAELNLMGQQTQVANTLLSIRRVYLYAGVAALAGGTQLIYLNSQLQQNLIEANSAFSNRMRLLRDTVAVTAATGVAFSKNVESARALVRYAYDTSVNYREVLRLVTEMNVGLGMSIDQAATLAVIFERQLGGSVEEMANMMATLVNSTALAADEAGRMAENLLRAVGALRPGVGQDMAAVTGVVGKYESALKELGGQFGAFTELLTKMTTIEGLPAAGMFGVASPEFLADAKATEAVIQNIGSMVGGMLRGLSGWQRQAQLDILAQYLGVSAQQLNLMVKAVEKANVEQLKAIDIHTRYREQVTAAGENLSRLANSLMSIVHTTLYPVIYGITWVIGKLADGVTWLLSHKPALVALSVALGGVLVAAIPSFFRLAAQLWHCMWASVAYTRQLIAETAARHVASGAQMMLPGMGGAAGAAGQAGGVRWLWTMLRAPLGYFGIILAAIAAGIAMIAYYVEAIRSVQRAAAETERQTGIMQETFKLKQALEFQARVKEGRIFGGAGTAEEMFRRATTQATRGEGEYKGMTYEQRMAKFHEEWDPILKGVGMARFMLGTSQFSTKYSPEALARDREMQKFQELTATGVTDMHKEAVRHNARIMRELRERQTDEYLDRQSKGTWYAPNWLQDTFEHWSWWPYGSK